MTKREIQEGNKLIKEFYGDISGITSYPDEPLEFHSSWDWLMPVIAKCTKSFEHHQYDSEEYYHITEEIFHPDYCLSEFMNNNIMAIFERVVMYIKWYNAHKKVNPESIYGNDMMQG
jgi:hypothetical protein